MFEIESILLLLAVVDQALEHREVEEEGIIIEIDMVVTVIEEEESMAGIEIEVVVDMCVVS